MTRCTPCWPYVWCCTPCASTRASTHTCVRSMPTSSSACRKGQLLFTLVFTVFLSGCLSVLCWESFNSKQLCMQKRSATVYFGLYCFFIWVFEHAVLGKFKLLKSSWSSVACFVDSEDWNLRIIHLVYVHFVFSPNFVIFYLPFFCHFLYTCSVLFSSIFFISTLPHPHCKVRKKEKRGGGGYIGMTLGTWASQHFLAVVFSGVNL